MATTIARSAFRCYVKADCVHPATVHVHGTRACYAYCGCRCTLCGIANGMYARQQDRDKLYANAGVEQYARMVDNAEARAHVEALRAAGWGTRRIAAKAGVPRSTITTLLHGRSNRSTSVDERRVLKRVAQALLAVPIPSIDDLADGALVDATPSTNRLRSLMRIGYPAACLARMLNVDRQRVDRLVTGGGQTKAVTHRAVAALFTRQWATPPPTHNRWHAAASTRARAIAINQGWPAPLDLNDDGHLDDLDTTDEPTPDIGVDVDVDMIAVKRVMYGEGTANLTSAETLAAVRLGLDLHMNATQIAERLHMRTSAVQQRITRAGWNSTNERQAA